MRILCKTVCAFLWSILKFCLIKYRFHPSFDSFYLLVSCWSVFCTKLTFISTLYCRRLNQNNNYGRCSETEKKQTKMTDMFLKARAESNQPIVSSESGIVLHPRPRRIPNPAKCKKKNNLFLTRFLEAINFEIFSWWGCLSKWANQRKIGKKKRATENSKKVIEDAVWFTWIQKH